MKTLKLLYLISFCLLFSLSSHAQKDTVGLNVPVNNGKILYEGVVESDLTKREIYENTRRWLVDNVENYKAVIQTEDNNQDHISAKATTAIKSFFLGIPNYYTDHFILQFDFKEGKCRYQIYGFQIEAVVKSMTNYKFYRLDDLLGKLSGTSTSEFSKANCRNLVRQNDIVIKSLISSYRSYVPNKHNDF